MASEKQSLTSGYGAEGGFLGLDNIGVFDRSASHQTGWTGLVAKIIQLFGLIDAEQMLAGGKQAAFVKTDNGTKLVKQYEEA